MATFFILINFINLVVMDYEMAAISAAEKVFPGASIQGCHFHFSQAIKRQLLTDMKIKAEESVEFALLIKSFYALAFLPPEHIEIAFVELKAISIFIKGFNSCTQIQ